MKASLVLLVGLCAYAALASSNYHTKITDKAFLEKQKDILRLFKYVNQPSYYKDHQEISKTFNLEQNFNDYTKPEVAQYFAKIYQFGLLPRGHIFSVFYEEHLQQAIALYKLFYYAKDYATFYKTAVWARNNVNEGLYLYSLSVAITHRPDTYKIVLPPIYEIYPYYFFNTEVITKVQQYKQQFNGQKNQENNVYTVNANYSGYYLNLNPEQALSYFTEDIGLNSFYYYYNIYYPSWLGGQDFDFKGDQRGEQFYFVYQQILARYYLERLANGYGEIEWFNYEVPFATGYYPSLRYANGLEFPTRPNFANLYEYFYNYGQKWNFKGKYGYSYTFVQDYERRIRDAIDRGYVFTFDGKRVDFTTEEGFNALGNLIESNPDSPNARFYGDLQTYARHLLGYSYQPTDKYHTAPSALEHYETSLRDPAFYQFYKRIVVFFQKYKSTLPHYHENDLYFNGVSVKNVEFDRLITYFDYFYTDLNHAFYVTPEEYEHNDFQVRARQYRLNHKAFTYKITVDSAQDQDASVFVYLGPKYDEYGRYINISENRLNFVLFDHFKYQLKSGVNTISRNSHENAYYHNDRTSYKELYQQVLGALEGNGEFYADQYQTFAGLPKRFLLPKGSYEGQEYQFFVFVNKFVPYTYGKNVEGQDYFLGTGYQRIDSYPLGYPLDRPINYQEFFYNVPNSYFYSTKIYHRHADDINASTAQH